MSTAPAPWEGDKQELGELRQEYYRTLGKSPGTMKPEKMLKLIAKAKATPTATKAPEKPKDLGPEKTADQLLAESPMRRASLDGRTAVVNTVAGQITICTKCDADMRRFVVQATKRLPIRKHVTVDCADGTRIIFLPGVGHVRISQKIDIPS